MHSEFACEFIVQSNYDHSTLEITFRSYRNIVRYFHFGPMEKLMKQINAIFVDHDVLYKISLLHPALYKVPVSF